MAGHCCSFRHDAGYFQDQRKVTVNKYKVEKMAEQFQNQLEEKSQVIESPQSIRVYLNYASSFKAAIYIRKGESLVYLKNARLSLVSTKDEDFILIKTDKSYRPVVEYDDFFSLVLKGSRIDFKSTCLAVGLIEKNTHKFRFPSRAVVYYEREFFRVAPATREPIAITFWETDLQEISESITVRDIGMGGIGFELKNVESVLKLGRTFESMEITFPDETSLLLCGQVKSLSGNRCGIQFIKNDNEDGQVIFTYVLKRETEIRQMLKEAPDEKESNQDRLREALLGEDDMSEDSEEESEKTSGERRRFSWLKRRKRE